MTRKQYAILGFVEYSVVVQLKGAYARVNFTGGQMSNMTGIRPATFTTSNTALQAAIENCSRFRNGVITLKSVEDTEEETKEEPTPAPQKPKEVAPKKEASSYPDVTNVQSAKAVLIESYNVNLAELQNKDSIKAKAAELKVEFPNWK